jgi:AraC-like DNA-binding protein
MGHGATRSQMDVRICLRVRERRDVDLILGQGMYNAGWHAHTLDAPGKFLISAPEHPHSKRARAYLITDGDVTTTADRHAEHRPVLNPPNPAPDPHTAPAPNLRQNDSECRESASKRPSPTRSETPEERLSSALLTAPEDGISVSELVKITGMSRRTLYRRLTEYVSSRRAVQIDRGRYRAVGPQRGDGS